MKRSNNKILITGGASGIGLAMAQRFVEEGNMVVMSGLSASTLAEARKKTPELVTRKCDLTSAELCVALAEWIVKEHSDLNVLV